MAKKKYKSEEDIIAKDEKSIRMEGVQNLYNFLFEACNILRGPVSQDNFKDYITPILYFKRISDVYDEETQAALDESGGDKEYASLPEQHRFVIPNGCHWIDIRERTENLGAAIVGAMRGIELANPDTLYGVLSVFSAQKWTDKKNLSDSKIRDLIEHLSTRRLGNKDYTADLMGDATKILTQKRAQNILSPEDVDHIYQLYLDYKDVEDYSKVVTLKEIEDKEFNLSPNRYINYHREAVRPYEEVKREFLEAIEAVKLAEQEFIRLIEN